MKKLAIPLLIISVILGCTEDNLRTNPRGNKVPNKADPLTPRKLDGPGPMAKQIGSWHFYDWSGQIDILIVAQEFGPGQINEGSVSLPSDYVLVGGGARTSATELDKGAFITKSYPEWGSNYWVGRSKDHHHADSHILTVYAVGMKLTGVTSQTLRSYMTVQQAIAPVASHPNISVYMPPPYKIIGGGAKAHNLTPGHLLVHSYPSSTNGDYWAVKAKDHIYGVQNAMTAYAIGIQDYIPGFGYLDIFGNTVNGWYKANSTTSGLKKLSGIESPSWFTSTGATHYYAPTCPGVRENYSNPNGGRMICSVFPSVTYYPGYGYTYGDDAVSSKDIVHATNGYLYYWLLGIRKRP